ncbi:Uncharacterised protein [Acinetobacter baumannii]|nr:Uncharacterised protein [Acinetobacter baumannii]
MKISSNVYVVSNMMVKTVQLTYVFHVFVQKLAMILKIQNVLKLYVVKVTCLLKKPMDCKI